MDDALLMGRFQGFGDLLGDGERFVDGDRSLLDAIRQRRSLDQLQDQRPRPLALLDAVDGGDVGVIQAGEDLRLPREPGEPVGSSAKASGRIFRATWRLSWVSVACQTWPMPPSPKSEVTS